MSKWWQQDMSDASQGLFSDPNLALQIATMPAQMLAVQQKDEEAARQARGGFLKQTMGLLSSAGNYLDGALSHVPGWGVTKDVGKAAWWPVDKTASGAYWLYSNAVSQPLSTLFLMSTTAQGSGISGKSATSWLSAGDWAKSWHKANNISPAQVMFNYENTTRASGVPTAFNSFLGTGADNLSKADKARVQQQQDKFINDTDFWRDKAGWKYTLGTGALDFMTSLGADPTYAGLKVTSSAIKGARSVKVAGQAAQASKSISGFNILADKAAQGAANLFAKTPEQIANSKAVNDFFTWSDGKSPFEIAQHPIWGTGRRVNPARDQLSQILSNADTVEKPMILRFAMGDNQAASQLAVKNQDLLSQIGRMSDNRKLVDSVKFDPDIFNHFMSETRAGRASAGSPFGPGIGGTSPTTLGNQLVEAPYPRPTTPGPRQAGWDATYGDLQKKANVYRSSAASILASGNGVRPMGGAAGTTLADALRFQAWKGDQLDLINKQIDVMRMKGGYYANTLGANAAKGVDDFSPGEANVFGSMKSLYRMGPLALRDAEAGADRGIISATRDRAGYKATGGFVSRTIRQGYYSVPVRIVQSFGDRLPSGMVDHNASDASDRVLDMLKRVPGLGQDTRLAMVNQYSMAGDKIAKSKALTAINKQVVEHMAGQHNLDEVTTNIVNQMIEDGTASTMAKLTGKNVPSDQMFSAAQNTATGKRADLVEDGDAWRIEPQAKTQLSYTDPLLNVKELDRFLSRNSGYLSSLKQSGGRVMDGVKDVTDSLSNVWKAATLLRPGYTLRAPSEEMAASAIKFGLMSSIADTIHGGKNWVLNRNQQLNAIVGRDSYASTIGGKARVQILDPGVAQAALDRGDQVTKINVSKAWPVIRQRIDGERSKLKAVTAQIEKMKKDPAHDPVVLQALRDDAIEHQSIIDEHTDYANEILRQAVDSTGRRIGEGTIVHNGVEVPQAFSKEWENPIPRDQITSEHAMETVFARGESIDTGRMIRTGNWTAVTPDMPNHMDSWLHAVNRQFGQDELFKLVAGDPTLRAARDWLKTNAGKYHLSQLGRQGREPDTLLQGIKDTLQWYLPTGALQRKMSRGEQITKADLHSSVAAEDFPAVHGEEVKGLTAQGHMATASAAIDSLIEAGFKRLSAIPTDILSRQPTYLRAQEARMRQLIDEELSYQKSVGKAGDSIQPAQLNAMLEKSDKLARKDISQVVYDPQRTTATQALRFITPFLSAHIDGLERWGGLIAEKPAFVGTAAKIYNAPVAANLVTDNQGNAVGEDGYANTYDADGKVTGRHFVGIQDRMLHLRVPFGTNGLPKKSGFEIPIKIQALNTILPGDPWWNPGTGPLVQVPASKLAKSDPAIGDFLQWAKVLPYGPQGFMDSFTPKYVKDAFTALNPDSGDFQKAMLAEYQRQVADYHNGGPAPDMKKAEANAKKFYYLKAFTSWMTPAQTSSTPLTGTPYQFYIDQYKKLQQVDPKTADDEFLKRYGEDYFIFSTSLSKSMGIAPTVSALNTAKKYKDLIAGDSSLAPFIIGDTYNQGAFSSSAYAAEQGMTIGGEKVRTNMSVQDAVAQNQINLGWAQYKKYMNAVDAALIRSGYHSYTQSGAEQFLALKQGVQSYLKQQYPSWEQDFDTTDKGDLPRRIESFKILVQDDRLKNDPMRQDIPALTMYLQMRDAYKAALAKRGVSQLSFGVNDEPQGPNADIANSWRAFQTGLVSQNTKFADVFNRYLTHDDLQ